jgi:hydrogenase nickel incorporation protein HypA/HybF
MSIAESVLEAVRAESARLGGARVSRVGLRVGELSGVQPDSLRFCFEALVKDSDLDPLALDLEFIPRTNTCRQCGAVFTVVDYDFTCPSCGGMETSVTAGDEMTLTYVEVEDA